MKPLPTVLSSAINKSQHHQEKNSWQCRELNPGLMAEKQVSSLCAMQPHSADFVCLMPIVNRNTHLKKKDFRNKCSSRLAVAIIPHDQEVQGSNSIGVGLFASFYPIRSTCLQHSELGHFSAIQKIKASLGIRLVRSLIRKFISLANKKHQEA